MVLKLTLLSFCGVYVCGSGFSVLFSIYSIQCRLILVKFNTEKELRTKKNTIVTWFGLRKANSTSEVYLP